MKKAILLTTILTSFAAQAGEYVPGKNYPVALRDESSTLDDWTVVPTNKPKPEPEKKAEPTKKSTGMISSPTTALVAGSALDLTKTILVGPSAKSESGASKGSSSTWTGNFGADIQNQGLDQTLFGSTSTDITNVGGGTTQIQFAGGGSSGAQQVNKKK